MKEELVYICEICQTVLEEGYSRAQCPNCGRIFDCTDLCSLPANAKVDGRDGVVPRPGSDLRDILPELIPDSTEESSPEESSSIANLP